MAGLVALVYLASVIMPAMALAFSDGAVSAYCFDEIAAEVAALQVQAHVHVHADGTVHHHVDHAKLAVQDGSEKGNGNPHHDQSHDANCCGAFGFTAVLPALSGLIQEARTLLAQPPMLSDYRAGCGPARIDRPPILLLPM
jgi:hypothetical protein